MLKDTCLRVLIGFISLGALLQPIAAGQQDLDSDKARTVKFGSHDNAARACVSQMLLSPHGFAMKPVLTLSVAERIVETAAQTAIESEARVVIAIVDDAGFLILLKRLDDTQIASVQGAIDSARTAAIYRRPSRDFEDQMAGTASTTGGLPIVVAGTVIGAIGVSGETPGIDEDIALVGVESLAAAIGSLATP